MKLLDTNVVIYSLGGNHRYRNSCIEILRQIAEGSADYITDAELLQEVLHLFHSRKDTARGIEAVNRLLALFPYVIPVGAPEVRLASRILAQYPRLSSRDAIHAAVVLAHGLEGLVSSDRAFDGITGLVGYDPVAMVAKGPEAIGEGPSR